MKKIILLIMALILTGSVAFSQVKIGENAAPVPGAILDLNSGTKGGMLLPNVDITDLGKIPETFSDVSVRGMDDAPALAGMVVWNTHPFNQGVYIWDGSDWKPVGGTTSPPADCYDAPTGVSISGFSGTYNLNAEFPVTCNATTKGLTSYTWAVSDPGLTIVSGQGTNQVTVKGTTGKIYAGNTISCTAKNTCGVDGPVTAETAVTINNCAAPPAAPASITLSSYSIEVGLTTTATCSVVDGATGYVWTLPAGVEPRNTVTASNALLITGKSPGVVDGGAITVKARNSCGDSPGFGSTVADLTILPVKFPHRSTDCLYNTKDQCTCRGGVRLSYRAASAAQRTAAHSWSFTWFDNDANGDTGGWRGAASYNVWEKISLTAGLWGAFYCFD